MQYQTNPTKDFLIPHPRFGMGPTPGHFRPWQPGYGLGPGLRRPPSAFPPYLGHHRFPHRPPAPPCSPGQMVVPPGSSTNLPPPSTITTSHWTVADAEKIRATEANSFPLFDLGMIHPLLPGYHVWDSWIVLDENGQRARVLGFQVLIALVYPLHQNGDNRERIAYFYTEDNCHYQFGGFLFNQPIYPNAREWSGSTILRQDGYLQTFYTAVSGILVNQIFQTKQQIATAIQSVHRNGSVLIIDNPIKHLLLAVPDGRLYETPQQSSQIENSYPNSHQLSLGSDQTDDFCFRDPKFFKDPVTQQPYLLFEGNTGPQFCPPGQVRASYLGYNDPNFQPTHDEIKANACVGVLQLTDQDYTSGHFLQPWLTANLVTDEIERINVVTSNGAIYLFVTSHGNKCALVDSNPDLINRDYLLGFRAKQLFGPLEPLNESGVILQQKSGGQIYTGQNSNPHYVYSWLMVPTEIDGLFDCICYAGSSTNAQGQIQAVRTAGPTVEIVVNGLTTRTVNLKYDILPS